MRVRAIRGAITVDEDRKDQLLDRTGRLLREILERNGLGADDVVSIVFTATSDLRSAVPAEAARTVGLKDVPVLCARELEVEGALPRVVRVLVHAYTDGSSVEHVYLEGARDLRADLQ